MEIEDKRLWDSNFLLIQGVRYTSGSRAQSHWREDLGSYWMFLYAFFFVDWILSSLFFLSFWVWKTESRAQRSWIQPVRGGTAWMWGSIPGISIRVWDCGDVSDEMKHIQNVAVVRGSRNFLFHQSNIRQQILLNVFFKIITYKESTSKVIIATSRYKLIDISSKISRYPSALSWRHIK